MTDSSKRRTAEERRERLDPQDAVDRGQENVLNERDLIELINQVELHPQQTETETEIGVASGEAALLSISMIEELSDDQRDEVERALTAQQLLSQLSAVTPPEDLPLNTARRVRRRRRQELVRPAKTLLDHLLSFAILVLVVAVVSLVLHHLRDERTRQRVEKLKVTPHHLQD